MSALWRSALRLVLLASVLVLGLLEGQAFLETLRSAGARREVLAARLRDVLSWLRPLGVRAFRDGGAQRCVQEVYDSLPTGLRSEVELLDEDGGRMASYPRAVPVEHALTEAQQQVLRNGGNAVVGPVSGADTRLLGYLELGGAYLRVGVEAPELVNDLAAERRRLTSHALALGVLIVTLLALVTPARPRPPSEPRTVAGLYEEAMHRLERGRQEDARRHQSELSRLGQVTRDLEVMARAGELTAGIVHEVRNGLGTIQGYAQLLERRSESPDGQLGRSIRQECEALEAVIRRFLEFARRETLRLEPLEMRRLLEGVLAHDARQGSLVATALDIDAGVYAGDETLLERAFENLVRNAREAAGPEGHVWVTARRGEDGWVVEISDDGPGLGPGQGQKPVRAFQSSKPGGLGLGLPLVQKIVSLHGGTLDLADRQPRGLSVVVTLPNPRPAVTDGSVEQPSAPQVPATKSLTNQT